MGFDVNFSSNKPTIQQAQSSQDGGAGNLGYFEREEGGEKKSKQKGNSIFAEQKDDSFQKEGAIIEDSSSFSISKIIAQIIIHIKTWLKRIF